jgi:hypothetical protein
MTGDLRESPRRELYRRPARTGDDLVRVADRVWYAVLKKAEPEAQPPAMAAWASASLARTVSMPSLNSSSGLISQVTSPNSG